MSLSIIETVVVFVGIPALVVAVVVGAVYAGGAKRARRYRPGRPFEFTPVWFLSAPEQVSADRVGEDRNAGRNGRAVTGANRMALSKADAERAPGSDETAAAMPDVTGGAHGTW